MTKGLLDLVEDQKINKSDVPFFNKWIDTGENGARLLTMPNIPTPLQGAGMQPRTLFGTSAWNKIRKQCYADANYHCEICGRDCSDSIMHCHEVYDIDYRKHTATFKRVVALCPLCHVKGIHSGRALTLYKKGVSYMTGDKLLEGAENAFKLIYEWNKSHPKNRPLLAFETFIDYAKQPMLETEMRRLIKKYDMHFYRVSEKAWSRKNWNDWRLIVDGVEYPTVYKDREEWEEAMEKNNTNNKISESKLSFSEELNKYFDELEKKLDK